MLTTESLQDFNASLFFSQTMIQYSLNFTKGVTMIATGYIKNCKKQVLTYVTGDIKELKKTWNGFGGGFY